ncbi:Protein of unknown function DUF3339, partial [Cynara cardunculus var. scolymus]
MLDWAPILVGLLLFILLSPGLIFQVPGNTRTVEFGSFSTNGKALKFITGDGGLGTSTGGGGTICAVNTGTVIPVAWSQQGGGVRKHAHQRSLHYCSRRYLFRCPHYLPHRHRRSCLRRLVIAVPA